MDFDSQEYERELEEARLELAVKWDPRKHPRDLLGRFRMVKDLAESLDVDLQVYENAGGGISLHNIKTRKAARGQGHATQVINEVLKIGDDFQMPVVLTPGEMKQPMTKNQLIAWYKRLGFKPNKGRNKDFRFMDTMIRNPQKDVSLAIVKFDPRKHPRDFLGRFREVLDQLEVGDSIELPRDVTVRRLTSGKTRVMRPSADGEDYDIPEDEVGKIAGIRKLERDVGQPLDTYNNRKAAGGRVKMIERDIAEAGLEGFIDDLNRESLERTLSIRMPELSFFSFADDNEYKTQHDVSDSQGHYDPERRDRQERYWWPGIVDEENRPIYGYLSGGPRDEEATAQYGTVIVKLKDEVKARTTFTLGDSLDEDEMNIRQIPMMIGGVDAFAVQEVFDNSISDNALRDVRNDLIEVTYWEAQIFGGVTLDDVAEVVFEQAPEDYMLEVMDLYDVPYRINEVERGPDGGERV